MDDGPIPMVVRKAHRHWRNKQLYLSGGGYAKHIAIGETNNFIFPVAMRLGEIPVLIPNTMVKTQAADGTMLETAWESRWLPDSEKTALRLLI